MFIVKAVSFPWVDILSKEVDPFMLGCDVIDRATPNWDSEVGGFNYSAAVVQPLQSCDLSIATYLCAQKNKIQEGHLKSAINTLIHLNSIQVSFLKSNKSLVKPTFYQCVT